MLAAGVFFDLSDWKHPALFSEQEPVWQVISRIKPYLGEALQPNLQGLAGYGPALTRTLVLYRGELISGGFRLFPGDATRGEFRVVQDGQELEGASVLFAGATFLGEDIFVGQGTVVEPGVLIKGPTVIGNRCEIRHGAYIRGHCLVGDGCVVGHVTEMKHSIMLNGAKAGHFAYIGDSILGNNTNLGAGTKLANLKITRTTVSVEIKGKRYDTGLRKLGAIIGDSTETGCNSVTNPGALLGRRCLVYPNVSVKGVYHPEGSRIF